MQFFVLVGQLLFPFTGLLRESPDKTCVQCADESDASQESSRSLLMALIAVIIAVAAVVGLTCGIVATALVMYQLKRGATGTSLL